MAGKDDSQSSGGISRKTTPATKPQQQQEQAAAIIKCPRCDSSNTKFCYYNNYSLTQPRHFCKTCRRYWTNGGALRNVPIGGGCRKNKKIKSTTTNSRLSIDQLSKDAISTTRSLSEIGGLKYFQPAIDFQLGGLNNNNNYPRVINSSYINNDQFPSFGAAPPPPPTPNPCFNQLLDPSASSSNHQMGPGFGFTNFPFSTNYQTNLASSIESLSSINQDLHYKLQQQRMAMLLNNNQDSEKEIGFSISSSGQMTQIQKPQPQPILFHNLEASRTQGSLADHLSRKEVGINNSSSGNLATEWFFDPTPTTTSSSTGIVNENGTTWNGIQAWSNINQFSPLP